MQGNSVVHFWRSFRANRGALAGLTVVLAFVLCAAFLPLLAQLDPDAMTASLSLPPYWSDGGVLASLLGTDDLGRDVLSRLVLGARISLGVGAAVILLALPAGMLLGLVAGVHGGLVDSVIMRLLDILMSIPGVMLAIVVVAILGPGLDNAVIAVSIVAVPKFARVMRASVLVEMRKAYVTAARSFGAGKPWLMFVEILPNCLAPVVVQATLGFGDAILEIAALGFLGLGARAPLPEWGTMLNDARPYIETAPWMVALPGLCILLVVLAFNLFGDGLRDALDPRMRR